VCTRRRCRVCLVIRSILVRISLEVLPKELDLIYEFVGAGFDWHARAVEPKREQSSLALHTRKARRKLDFADGESMPCVQSTVHVRIRHCAKEFGVLGSKLGGGDGVEGDF
jgi:hypothetical protein